MLWKEPMQGKSILTERASTTDAKSTIRKAARPQAAHAQDNARESTAASVAV